MRCLEINKRRLWYALYLGRTANTENGFETGEYSNSYSDPVAFRANVSPAAGRVGIDVFGESLDYERVIVCDYVDLPVKEDSILFIEHEPEQNSSGNWNYDYIVKRISRSINSVAIAVSRRDVS